MWVCTRATWGCTHGQYGGLRMGVCTWGSRCQRHGGLHFAHACPVTQACAENSIMKTIVPEAWGGPLACWGARACPWLKPPAVQQCHVLTIRACSGAMEVLHTEVQQGSWVSGRARQDMCVMQVEQE